MKTNLCLIVGDPLLRSQKAKTIAADFEKKAGGSFAHQSFRLEETSLDAILSNARTLPFLTEGQVFYIQSAERLKAADLELLEAYLANPNASTALIFEAESLEGKTELQKFMKVKGQVMVLAKEEARSAAQGYLQQKLVRFKKTMPFAAKARLLEMCGEAVVFLDTMLDRLIQYAGDQTEITEEMVAEFEEKWTSVTVFQLTNALLASDREKAVRIFHELMEDYEVDLVSLIGILHWQLRSLWLGAVLLEAGTSESAIFSQLKMPPFRQRGFMAGVRALGLEKIEKAVESLYQLDRKTKVGQMDGVIGIESWLMEYAGK